MDKKFAQNPLAPACDHPGDHQRFPSPRFANWSDPTSVNSGPDLWANQNCWKFTFGKRIIPITMHNDLNTF